MKEVDEEKLTQSERQELSYKLNKSFFGRKTCERCRASLEDGRTLSMFNSETICLWCKEVEELHPDYEKARIEDKKAYNKGLKFFVGIGVDKEDLDKIENGC